LALEDGWSHLARLVAAARASWATTAFIHQMKEPDEG